MGIHQCDSENSFNSLPGDAVVVVDVGVLGLQGAACQHVQQAHPQRQQQPYK